MDVLTAHALLARRTDRSSFPEFTASLRGIDAWPSLATAAAKLSGRLDDCYCDEDLDEALEHFRSLLSAGVVTEDQLRHETINVLQALINDGRRMEAQLN